MRLNDPPDTAEPLDTRAGGRQHTHEQTDMFTLLILSPEMSLRDRRREKVNAHRSETALRLSSATFVRFCSAGLVCFASVADERSRRRFGGSKNKDSGEMGKKWGMGHVPGEMGEIKMRKGRRESNPGARAADDLSNPHVF